MTHNNGVFIVVVEDDQDEDLEFPDREFLFGSRSVSSDIYGGTIIILISGYSKDANAYKKVGNLDKLYICMSPLKMFACLC